MSTMATGSLKQYVHLVERAYRAAQGPMFARLLSLRDEHVKNRNLRSNDVVPIVEDNCSAPINEIIVSHLICVKALYEKEYVLAFEHQSNCVEIIVRIVQTQTEDYWIIPVMYTVCLDLRLVAQKADKLTPPTNVIIMEKAAESILACFRVCAADNRSSDVYTKKLGVLNLINQLFKIYYRINKLHMCEPLIRVIDSLPYTDEFPLAQLIKNRYQSLWAQTL